MNLDLFLVQKVVQSLFTNDANTTLMPLQTSPKNENKEGEEKENNKDRRKLIEVYSMLYDKMNAAKLYVNTQKILAVLSVKKLQLTLLHKFRDQNHFRVHILRQKYHNT